MEKSLRQFLAVAEVKNLSLAAKRLFISQPTLTHNMKKLEATLGVELFVRSSRGMALTPYGDLLLEQARIMQRVHDNAMAQLDQLKVQRERGIRVGVGMAWWHMFFRDLLREYRHDYPTAPAHIELGNHLRSMDQLLCGDIDLFLGHRIEGLNEKSGAAFFPLFSCQNGAYVRAGHPLLQQIEHRLRDVLEYPHLDITPDESRFTEVVDNPTLKAAQRRAYQLQERVVWSTSSMSAGLDILRDSDAVMFYASTMGEYFARQGLKELNLPPAQQYAVGVYCLRERRQESAIQHLLALIQTYLGKVDYHGRRITAISKAVWQ